MKVVKKGQNYIHIWWMLNARLLLGGKVEKGKNLRGIFIRKNQ